jgi:hypothetical protein
MEIISSKPDNEDVNNNNEPHASNSNGQGKEIHVIVDQRQMKYGQKSFLKLASSYAITGYGFAKENSLLFPHVPHNINIKCVLFRSTSHLLL